MAFSYDRRGVLMVVTWLVLVAWEGFLLVSSFSIYYVNGPFGWKNWDPESHEAPDFAAWASSHTIYPGDQIVFDYPRGFHDVHEFVDEAAFETCNFTSALLLDPGISGSFTWIPLEVGVYYFGCGHAVEGFGTHCTTGQKVAIPVFSPPPNIPVNTPPLQQPPPQEGSINMPPPPEAPPPPQVVHINARPLEQNPSPHK